MPGANGRRPQRRRWLRFSLRTLLVAVTVFGVLLGVKVDQARRQKRAVDALRALGAEVAYEHQRVKNGFDSKIELHVPIWARELCGDDFFQTVKAVSFRGKPSRIERKRTHIKSPTRIYNAWQICRIWCGCTSTRRQSRMPA